MTIAAILASKGRKVMSVDSAIAVAEAVELLAKHRIGALPVTQGGNVAGIFSERDLVYGLNREGEALLARRVGDVMTAPAITVDPGETVLGALALMTQRRIRHLPVIEDGRCTGFVSIGDLVKYRIERIESEAAAMRSYIQAV